MRVNVCSTGSSAAEGTLKTLMTSIAIALLAAIGLAPVAQASELDEAGEIVCSGLDTTDNRPWYLIGVVMGLEAQGLTTEEANAGVAAVVAHSCPEFLPDVARAFRR